MLLVDYKYYSSTECYGGSSIPESSFKPKAIEASNKVNYYTFNRIDEEILNQEKIGDNIKDITCQIAELLFEQEKLKNKVSQSSIESKEVASETLGPHSISYVNKANIQAAQILSEEELESKIYKIVYQALIHTSLMYRGIYE